jgi:hypothetical protein
MPFWNRGSDSVPDRATKAGTFIPHAPKNPGFAQDAKQRFRQSECKDPNSGGPVLQPGTLPSDGRYDLMQGKAKLRAMKAATYR